METQKVKGFSIQYLTDSPAKNTIYYKRVKAVLNIFDKECKECKEKVTFVYLKKDDFKKDDFINTIADKITENQYNFSSKNAFHKPLIFLSGKKLSDKKKHINRLQFLDSSIWLMYIYLKNKKESQYINIVKEIKKNLDLKLYEKQINRDSFIFHAYLVKNVFSEVNQFAKPFTFHSESDMKDRLTKFLDHKNKNNLNFHINTIRNLKWKFLLVAENDEKKERINYLLNMIASMEGKTKSDEANNSILNPTNNISFTVELVTSVKDANDKLKEKQYDIILTDYLLKKDTNTIELIKQLEENQYKKGPFGRNWIFPATVFSEAYFNTLRDADLGHINNNSFVNSGADPYNTPYLFLYKLIMFMNLQLKEVVFTVPNLLNVFQTFLANLQSESSNKIKRSAGASYGELMYRFGKKSMIAYDRKEGSYLAESLYTNYLRNDLDGVLQKFEHIREFLYLLAYGGIDDRTKLVSELIFINEQIKPLLLKNETKEESNKTIKSFKNLNKYIYNL